jgi:hypothetical protein
MTPALRRARAVAQVQVEIDALEARLAEWREALREVEADDYRGADEWEDDWDELDDEGAEDGADEDDGDEEEDVDGGYENEDGGDGRDGRCDWAGDPCPLAPGGRVASPVGGGEARCGGGEGDPAGCEWAVPAGVAGAAGGGAERGFGAGGADDPEGLRGAPG